MTTQISNPVAVTILCNGSGPPPGFVKRPRPVFPEFVTKAPWWPVQYHEYIKDDESVWLWIPKEDNLAYERGEALRKKHIVHEKRWCESRVEITNLARGKTMWFPASVYFTVVSSIHSVLQAYPGRKIQFARLKKGKESGVLVRRTK